MMRKQRDKMNLKILGMLRQKGAPALTPFPGEQGFESEDIDVDGTGDIVTATTGVSDSAERRKKKRRPEDFVAAEESVNIIGKP